MQHDDQRTDALGDVELVRRIAEIVREGLEPGLLHRIVVEQTQRILEFLQRLENLLEIAAGKDRAEEFHQVAQLLAFDAQRVNLLVGRLGRQAGRDAADPAITLPDQFAGQIKRGAAGIRAGQQLASPGKQLGQGLDFLLIALAAQMGGQLGMLCRPPVAKPREHPVQPGMHPSGTRSQKSCWASR